jgi:hypothetical protein
MVIEGLLNFVAVRDFLYSRMRGARHTGDAHPAHAAAPESVAAVLGEVAAELRAVRQALEKRNA